MAQTTIQKQAAIRKGSVRVQIGDDFSSLVDIGAIRDPRLVSLVEQQNIEFDNVDDLRQFAEGDKCQFEFVLTEINLTNLAKFDKGLVNLTTVAGTPVSGAEQVIASPFVPNKFYKLENQMGDGSAPTINSVTGATDGALDADDDYHLVVNGQGEYGIVLNTVAGGTNITTLSQAITIDYDYTPAASKKITFTKQGTKDEIVMRLVNKDADDKEFRIDVEKVTNVQAPAIDFAGDDEAEVATVPMTLQGYIKELVDEQQVT